MDDTCYLCRGMLDDVEHWIRLAGVLHPICERCAAGRADEEEGEHA